MGSLCFRLPLSLPLAARTTHGRHGILLHHTTHHSAGPCVRALSSRATLPLSAPSVILDVYLITKFAVGVFLRSVADGLRECTVPKNQPVALFESHPYRTQSCRALDCLLVSPGLSPGQSSPVLVVMWCRRGGGCRGCTAARCATYQSPLLRARGAVLRAASRARGAVAAGRLCRAPPRGRPRRKE